MKKSLCIMALGLLVLFAGGAEETIPADPSGEFRIYAGAGVTQLDGEPVLALNGRISYNLKEWLDLGAEASAYHTLEREYSDSMGRTFQAESGSWGLFLRPNWDLTDRLNLGISLSSGTQLILLRYTSEYRDDMDWTEEIRDQLVVTYTALSVSMEYTLCADHSLFLEGGYRQLHPFGSPYLNKEEESAGFFGGLYYGIKL